MSSDNGYFSDRSDMSLEELRDELSKIDKQLVDLIAERTYVAYSLSDLKAEQGLPIIDKEQEAYVLRQAEKSARKYDIDENLTKAIFRLLMELNKIEQRESR